MWRLAQWLAYEEEVFPGRAENPGEPGKWLLMLGVVAILAIIGVFYVVGMRMRERIRQRHGDDALPRSMRRIDPHQL